MHILWVNEAADFVGGCEHYIYNTVRLLRERGVRSSLLYDCRQRQFEAEFVQPFDQAFPLVDVQIQVAEMAPDLIYIHRLSGRETVMKLRDTHVPAVRFFHDTKLFCPREHRYTTFGHQTCNKPMGLRCYVPCLGVINRTDGPVGIRLNPVRALRRELEVNCGISGYVVASRYMAQLLAEHGLAQDRTRTLPLYSLPPDNIPLPAREPDLFLFVGQLIRSKGLDTLLLAMTRTTRPCRLVIAGQGRQETMFRSMAQRLGLAERVRFVGRIARDELATWYSRAACVVLPVRQPESFALVGPEAMSYGTPVIATAIGGVDTWLENGTTGITVPPNAASPLAHAMDALMEGKELRETMGHNARRRYEALFRPEHHVNGLCDLFEEVVGGGVV